MTTPADSEQPSITADGDRVLIHLPEIHSLDTQVWAVDICISTDALRQLRDAADAYLATVDTTQQTDTEPVRPASPCPHGCDVSQCPCLECEAEQSEESP